MAVQLPPMHALIRSAGVQVKDSLCSCCLVRPLYEICTTPTLAKPTRRDLFLVCAACDVEHEQRHKT